MEMPPVCSVLASEALGMINPVTTEVTTNGVSCPLERAVGPVVNLARVERVCQVMSPDGPTVKAWPGSRYPWARVCPT